MTAAFSTLHDFHNQYGEGDIAITYTPRDERFPSVDAQIVAQDGPIHEAAVASRSILLADQSEEGGTPWSIPLNDDLRTGATAAAQSLRELGVLR